MVRRGVLISENVAEVQVEVQRKEGIDGRVEIKWRSIPEGKFEGAKHPLPIKGILRFNHGEVLKAIKVPLNPEKNPGNKIETFEVELLPDLNPAGATLGNAVKTSVMIADDAGSF